MSVFRIPKSTILKMITHSFHELPHEACGLLVIEDGMAVARPCKNDSPTTDAFEMCCDDLLRIHQEGLPIIGTYHSHPKGLPSPSEGDIDLLPRDQLHFIVGMRDEVSVRAWQYRGKSAHSQRYEVINS